MFVDNHALTIDGGIFKLREMALTSQRIKGKKKDGNNDKSDDNNVFSDDDDDADNNDNAKERIDYKNAQ